ncbi:hypothetical protein HVY04_18500 [Citrobacter freundii]|uniref:hypothetical protein n=1 Tax=Citrobacter freundii TaxID=546 RepID=UPI0015E9F1B0|nr:hypothetical protein [Citrobacter freundii]QMJ05006.1 hypothetical protein HVY06_18520 [Citrobacter freundii]QMJ14071.1 hypothetical protein HVY04_18500 [Citrobacter freundii]
MLTRTVRPLLAEQYSDMLARDFRSRSTLLSSHCHTLSDLARFDQHMLTCLQGMMLLKEQTSAYLRGQLQEPLSAGELFSVALFAVGTDDEFLLSGCLGLTQVLPRLLPVLLSTADWMPAQSSLWSQILSLPACRAYVAATRNDQVTSVMFSQKDVLALIEQGRCVDYLLYFLCRNDSPLFIPALEMVFSSGRDELILQGCRAVLCLHFLADKYTDTAVRLLHLLTHSKRGSIRITAAQYLLIHQADVSHDLVSRFAEDDTDIRLLIQAMGWSGLPEYIPSLMTYFDKPEYARLSVLSVIAITGSLPERDGWQCKKSEENRLTAIPGSADIPQRDPEQGVSWPEKETFDRWWQTHRGNFTPDMSYLCGQLTTPEGLNTVLKQGYLYFRPLALMRMRQFSERAALPAPAQHLLSGLTTENK